MPFFNAESLLKQTSQLSGGFKEGPQAKNKILKLKAWNSANEEDRTLRLRILPSAQYLKDPNSVDPNSLEFLGKPMREVSINEPGENGKFMGNYRFAVTDNPSPLEMYIEDLISKGIVSGFKGQTPKITTKMYINVQKLIKKRDGSIVPAVEDGTNDPAPIFAMNLSMSAIGEIAKSISSNEQVPQDIGQLPLMAMDPSNALPVTLVLSKNPASWSATLSSLPQYALGPLTNDIVAQIDDFADVNMPTEEYDPNALENLKKRVEKLSSQPEGNMPSGDLFGGGNTAPTQGYSKEQFGTQAPSAPVTPPTQPSQGTFASAGTQPYQAPQTTQPTQESFGSQPYQAPQATTQETPNLNVDPFATQAPTENKATIFFQGLQQADGANISDSDLPF